MACSTFVLGLRSTGRYFGLPDGRSLHLALLQAKRALQPPSAADYDAGRLIASRGFDRTQTFESYAHNKLWKASKVQPDFLGMSQWSSGDVATTVGAEVYGRRKNPKDLSISDCSICNDEFHIDKAIRSTAPTSKIKRCRSEDRTYPVNDLSVSMAFIHRKHDAIALGIEIKP